MFEMTRLRANRIKVSQPPASKPCSASLLATCHFAWKNRKREESLRNSFISALVYQKLEETVQRVTSTGEKQYHPVTPKPPVTVVRGIEKALKQRNGFEKRKEEEEHSMCKHSTTTTTHTPPAPHSRSSYKSLRRKRPPRCCYVRLHLSCQPRPLI